MSGRKRWTHLDQVVGEGAIGNGATAPGPFDFDRYGDGTYVDPKNDPPERVQANRMGLDRFADTFAAESFIRAPSKVDWEWSEPVRFAPGSHAYWQQDDGRWQKFTVTEDGHLGERADDILYEGKFTAG